MKVVLTIAINVHCNLIPSANEQTEAAVACWNDVLEQAITIHVNPEGVCRNRPWLNDRRDISNFG